MLYRIVVPSPMGSLTLVSREDHILALEPMHQGSFREIPVRRTPVLASADDWLRRYFSGEQPDPRELPLAPSGSDFQKAVWQQLLTIPWGHTWTYGSIARNFGPRMSPQAVGGAVGRNPIPLIIPCHRVVGSNYLGGYAYGVGCKLRLLQYEGADLSHLRLPEISDWEVKNEMF